MKAIKGKACKHQLTKRLVEKIDRDCIAVIRHRDIDLVAAQDLKYKKVKAIINCERTIDHQSIGDGVRYLVDNDIKVYDVYDKDFFDHVYDGEHISIVKDMLYINKIFYTHCTPVLKRDIQCFNTNANYRDKKYNFVKNTMEYMGNELEYFIKDHNLPDLNTDISGKDVIIICRGRGYREDLKSIKQFILKSNPVLIGVDGGADALTAIGLRSHIIIGDMDSVSDKSLMNCGEIVVHTYCSGYAPGLQRVRERELNYKLIRLKGTSEDAAVYMAKLKGALKIYLIGSHIGFDEFIEKGRQGMGSTALLRILFGSSIVDLKGISNIQRYNCIKIIKTSIMFVCALLIIVFASSYSSLFEYLKTQIRTLFDAI